MMRLTPPHLMPRKPACAPFTHRWTPSSTRGLQICLICGRWAWCPRCRGSIHAVGSYLVLCRSCAGATQEKGRVQP